MPNNQKEKIEEAYQAGLDKHKNGADESNCNFKHFATPEQTKAWEKGAEGLPLYNPQPQEDEEWEDEFDDDINSAKKEVGNIPENTCPDIDKALDELEDLQSSLSYLEKNVHRYETPDDLVKDFPDYGWLHTPGILEKLRKDNDQLRSLGKFWYEKCVNLKSFIRIKKQEWIEKERERINAELKQNIRYTRALTDTAFNEGLEVAQSIVDNSK